MKEMIKLLEDALLEIQDASMNWTSDQEEAYEYRYLLPEEALEYIYRIASDALDQLSKRREKEQ